jgi:hypothetical protein
MTGATSGAGTTYPSGAPKFTPVFSGVRVTFQEFVFIWLLALSIYEWFEGIDPAEYTALERLRGKTKEEGCMDCFTKYM